jgi:hypothetical protein
MQCPTCGQPADLLKNPCCESAWADHVVEHPSDAVAALQRADYEGAVRLASEQLAVASGVITAARIARGEPAPSSPPTGFQRGYILVDKLRASVGRVAGATISRDEQHTLTHRAKLRLSWRERLAAAWHGRLDVEAAVRTERLPGRGSWLLRVVP